MFNKYLFFILFYLEYYALYDAKIDVNLFNMIFLWFPLDFFQLRRKVSCLRDFSYLLNKKKNYIIQWNTLWIIHFTRMIIHQGEKPQSVVRGIWFNSSIASIELIMWFWAICGASDTTSLINVVFQFSINSNMLYDTICRWYCVGLKLRGFYWSGKERKKRLKEYLYHFFSHN